MKKWISMLLTLALLLGCCPALSLQADAADVTFTYTVDGDGATITGVATGTTVSGDLEIPDNLDGYPVVAIGDRAFEKCTELEAIEIPESVTSIGSYAFLNCDNIEKLVIPDSVTEIGKGAFWSCDRLAWVKLSGSLKRIEEHAFSGTDLRSITIPEGVTSIGDSAFYACSQMQSVTIPASVTGIEEWAFDTCNGMYYVFYTGTRSQWEEINIMSGNTYLQEAELDTEAGVVSAISIQSLPIKTVYLSGMPFDSTGLMYTVTWADGTTTEANPGANINGYNSSLIGELELVLHYRGAWQTFTVTIMEELSGTCGENATWSIENDSEFGWCMKISGTGVITASGDWETYKSLINTVVIESGITAIGDHAFDDCTYLNTAVIPESVTSIGDYAFDGCSDLETVHYAGSENEWKRIAVGANNMPLLEATLNAGEIPYVTGISVKSLPQKTIYGVGEEVDTTGLVLAATWSDDAITEITEDYLIQHAQFVESGVYTVTVEYAGFSVTFSVEVITGTSGDCGENLTWELDENGVLTISGSGVLQEAPWYNQAEKVTKVILEEGVTGIECNAFEDCTNLVKISIPKSLTFIQDGAFCGCDSLITVDIADITAWCELSYEYENPLVANGEEKQLLLNGELITELVIPEGVTKLNRYAFVSCGQLTSVRLPSSLTSIGDYVFRDCVNLEYVELPDSIERVGYGTFDGCEKLQLNEFDNAYYLGSSQNPYLILVAAKDMEIAECQIHEDTRIIGAIAFNACKNLTEIVIPDSVVTIEDAAFSVCSNLATVKLPATLSYLGEEAFTECSSLTEITIPQGLEVIEQVTFLGCTQLVEITIPDSVRTIAWGAFLDCNSLTDVYYGGKMSQWNEIAIEECNDPLQNVTIHAQKKALTIVSQPQDVRVEFGETAIFTVQAEGEGLTYQWQWSFEAEEWEDVGDNTNTLIIENVEREHHRKWYQCIITDQDGNTVTSEVAILRIPFVQQQPQSQVVEENQSVFFAVTYSMVFYGYEGVTYQWQYKENAAATTWEPAYMKGAQTEVMYFNARAYHNGYVFRCVINDNGIEVITDEAMLTIRSNELEITEQPESITRFPGDAASFTVGAEGEGLTYKWYYRNAGETSWRATSLSGYNTDTLSVSNAVVGSTHNGRQYMCKITDAEGNVVETEPATLTVIYMVNEVKSQSVQIGETAVFTFNYSSTDGVTYRWEYKGNTASSAWANTSATGNKTNSLQVVAKATNNRYMYRCKITDPNIVDENGDVVPFYTKEVYLNVVEDPAVITANPMDTSAVSGDKAYFEVAAEGDGLAYQWQWSDDGENWANTKSTGYNTVKLTVKTNNFISGRYYRCVVKSYNGSGWNRTYTEAAQLTVQPAADIQEPLPETVTVKVGETVTIHVEAEGEDLEYQWQWAKFKGNWKNTSLTGCNTDTLTVDNVRTDMNGRYYRVIITNAYGGYVETVAVQLIVEE